jgi:hypothetical protein
MTYSCVGVASLALSILQICCSVTPADGLIECPLMAHIDRSCAGTRCALLGYSDMAIGLGRLLGFHFPENFDSPYRSANVTEFWRRWHKTLSRWFRDFVDIPLGGNWHGCLRTFVKLCIVFFLCGL